MLHATHCKSIVGVEFFKPISRFLDSSRLRRNCPALPDDLWLTAGIRRCLGLFQSGRDFLQDLAERHDTEILPTTFFESLKSKRRLALLSDMVAKSQVHMRREMPDTFAAFRCLDDFDLYAGDGHFIGAASHDKAAPRKNPAGKTKAGKSKSSKSKAKAPGRTAAFTATKYATGHLYTLDLRTHCMTHLTVSDQLERKKEHDMRALKRQTIETLRQGAAIGRKPLYIWDRAGIDFRQWDEWKQSGIYFLSREKANMNLDVMGVHSFDKTDPVNQGIIADEIVGTSMGVSVRRVTYEDPETQTIYTYLTNLPVGVPPGIIALLYKSRWDVEKVFDEFKNKLGETKAWGSTANAKSCQARLLCLTHNLMTLMEEKILRETGIHNTAETKRKAERLATRDEQSKSRGGTGLTVLQQSIQRLTQRTVKFIRWLKNHMDSKHSWTHALARLARIYARS
jgi:hypothetical protein